ncbi:MAG: hypothetical protein R6U32_03775 [Candidatus Woesearchaeota archaeon]
MESPTKKEAGERHSLNDPSLDFLLSRALDGYHKTNDSEDVADWTRVSFQKGSLEEAAEFTAGEIKGTAHLTLIVADSEQGANGRGARENNTAGSAELSYHCVMCIDMKTLIEDAEDISKSNGMKEIPRAVSTIVDYGTNIISGFAESLMNGPQLTNDVFRENMRGILKEVMISEDPALNNDPNERIYIEMTANPDKARIDFNSQSASYDEGTYMMVRGETKKPPSQKPFTMEYISGKRITPRKFRKAVIEQSLHRTDQREGQGDERECRDGNMYSDDRMNAEEHPQEILSYLRTLPLIAEVSRKHALAGQYMQAIEDLDTIQKMYGDSIDSYSEKRGGDTLLGAMHEKIMVELPGIYGTLDDLDDRKRKFESQQASGSIAETQSEIKKSLDMMDNITASLNTMYRTLCENIGIPANNIFSYDVSEGDDFVMAAPGQQESYDGRSASGRPS